MIFGGGVYGQRFTGTYNCEKNTRTVKPLPTISGVLNLVNYGGVITYLDNNNKKLKMPIGSFDDIQGYACIVYYEQYVKFQLLLKIVNFAQTSAPYDIWILYTK